ncbi:MAG TPA: alpha/beta hydrolase [Allosphingosinicella sp.]
MQQFVASDGVAIAFESEGAGRPVVLLHGLMAHGGFFEPQRLLAEDFRMIRIDLRGHGRSPAGGTAVTVERLARDVAELAEELDLENAICIGWSLGASVLWRLLAGPASARFAGAVVIDMTPRVLNEADWSLGLSGEVCEARRQAIADDFETFAANAGAAIFAQPAEPGIKPLADWAAHEFARNDAAAIGTLWASLVDEDLRPLLARIAQPTLVVHGAQSHLYGADTAEHVAAALPNAESLRFERSGHSPHLEQPDLFNAAIRDFAASLPPVRTTQLIAE